jgi:hypothetical protein
MKNDEKIFSNFWLFSDAGINKMQEKPVKTISDLNKMHLNAIIEHGIKFDCCMDLGALMLQKYQKKFKCF